MDEDTKSMLKLLSAIIVMAIVVLAILLLTGCSKKETKFKGPFHGDYSTENTRTMWSACFTANVQNNPPYVPKTFWVAVCDCMMDQTRTDHSHEYMASRKKGEMVKYFATLNNVCVEKVKKKNIENTKKEAI